MIHFLSKDKSNGIVLLPFLGEIFFTTAIWNSVVGIQVWNNVEMDVRMV